MAGVYYSRLMMPRSLRSPCEMAAVRIFFVTNNSTKSRKGYKKKFDSLGLVSSGKGRRALNPPRVTGGSLGHHGTLVARGGTQGSRRRPHLCYVRLQARGCFGASGASGRVIEGKTSAVRI